MNYVIEISGGIGKHIMATSFIKWINEKFPKSKITVISGFPELFEYNPRIHRNLRVGSSYLFEDYIQGNDLRRGEPYSLYEYYREKNKKHVMELYPMAYGFNEYNKEPQSEIYLTSGEDMDGKVYNEQNPNLITLQAFGGLLPGMAYNKDKLDMAGRDMHFMVACRIVDLLNMKGYRVLQIRSQGEKPIPNTLQLNIPFRNLLPIIRHAKGHIGIDSSAMHAAAVFKKPQMIFWGNTHKDNLGYKYDGVVNVFNKHGMHCRPFLQVHDQAGVFPFKNLENDGKEFLYSEEEIKGFVDKFILTLKGCSA